MTSRISAAAVILLAASIAAPAFSQAPGADTYKAKCAMCPAMVKASDAQFFASTKNGKNKMPAYNGKLTDAQIKDVIAYIRALQK
jgi:mono/diheme cytochrome c family protein